MCVCGGGGGVVDGGRGALLLIFDHHIDGVLYIGSLDLKPFGESYIKYTTLSHGCDIEVSGIKVLKCF